MGKETASLKQCQSVEFRHQDHEPTTTVLSIPNSMISKTNMPRSRTAVYRIIRYTTVT